MSNRYIRFLLISLAGKVVSEMLVKEKKKSKNSLNLPSFKGVIEVKHSLRGRVRLYVPIVKNNEEAGQLLISQLGRVETISHIEVNSVTGSVVIKYDAEKIDPALLIGVVAKLLQIESELTKNKEALVSKELGNVKEALNMSIYNKTNGILDMKSVYIIMILFFGVRKIRQMPTMLPNGYSMIRWAYKDI
ncbi:HMA2 domain-containing protein [uncultured Clostridium sp.]|uniref:HMA2 domain-containing protein n=1 Tax=uncultured Clostridium sp. TaxID=59620 RepID=UPI002623BB40|nr:hypothetical protein [uncultured Clostridium sp.]